MNVYGKDQRIHNGDRTHLESWVMHSYTATTGLQGSCIVVSMFRMRRRLENVLYNNYYVATPLQLNEVYYTPGCVAHVNEGISLFRNVTFSVTKTNVEYFFSRSTFHTRLLFFLVAIITLVSLVNHTMLWLNASKVRYRFLVVRKDALAVFQVALGVAGLFQNSIVSQEHGYLRRYFEFCEPRHYPGLHYVTPFNEFYLLFGGTLIIFGINFFIALAIRCRENPKDEFIRNEQLREAEMNAVLQQQQEGEGVVGGNPTMGGSPFMHQHGGSAVGSAPERGEGGRMEPLSTPMSHMSVGRYNATTPHTPKLRVSRLSRSGAGGVAAESHCPSWPAVNKRKTVLASVEAPAFDDIIGNSTHR